MATQEKWNNAPPQNLVIAACAIVSVLVLFSLKFGFDAYYDGVRDAHVADRLVTFDDLGQLGEAQGRWDDQLRRGNPRSIDDAMSQLSARGRTGFREIAPEASGEMNLAPLEGWNQLPQEVVVPEQPAPQAAQPTGTVSPEALQQLEDAIRQALQRQQATEQ